MPRTPYEMFVKLRQHKAPLINETSEKKSKKRSKGGSLAIDYTQDYVNAVAASFRFEYGARGKELPIFMNELALVELGIGYYHREKKVEMRYEPLVQQAGRNYRLDKHPTHAANNVKLGSHNPSVMGAEFEYVVAESGLPFLLRKPFKVRGMHAIFGGEWLLPEPQFGCMAEPCEDGSDLYKWLTKALDIDCWNSSDPPLGMMFPKNHAGPDIVAILLKRDNNTKKVTSLALLLAQVKLQDDINEEKAFRTVDPALMNHTKRDGEKKPVKKYEKAHNNFLNQIKEIPVVRVLVSGAQKVSLLTQFIEGQFICRLIFFV